METQQRILCRRELPFGHQPAFITKRKTGYLIRQLQLQLLASVGQRRTELKKMPLYQAGGRSDDHNYPWYGRMEVWHKDLSFYC